MHMAVLLPMALIIEGCCLENCRHTAHEKEQLMKNGMNYNLLLSALDKAENGPVKLPFFAQVGSGESSIGGGILIGW